MNMEQPISSPETHEDINLRTEVDVIFLRHSSFYKHKNRHEKPVNYDGEDIVDTDDPIASVIEHDGKTYAPAYRIPGSIDVKGVERAREKGSDIAQRYLGDLPDDETAVIVPISSPSRWPNEKTGEFFGNRTIGTSVFMTKGMNDFINSHGLEDRATVLNIEGERGDETRLISRLGGVALDERASEAGYNYIHGANPPSVMKDMAQEIVEGSQLKHQLEWVKNNAKLKRIALEHGVKNAREVSKGMLELSDELRDTALRHMGETDDGGKRKYLFIVSTHNLTMDAYAHWDLESEEEAELMYKDTDTLETRYNSELNEWEITNRRVNTSSKAEMKSA